MTKLRGLAKEAALKVELLDNAKDRNQEAVDIAARELALYVSVIDYKKMQKKGKKFAY